MYVIAKIDGQAVYAHSATEHTVERVTFNVENSARDMGHETFEILETDNNHFDDLD